jgi:hypothetical protein
MHQSIRSGAGDSTEFSSDCYRRPDAPLKVIPFLFHGVGPNADVHHCGVLWPTRVSKPGHARERSTRPFT